MSEISMQQSCQICWSSGLQHWCSFTELVLYSVLGIRVISGVNCPWVLHHGTRPFTSVNDVPCVHTAESLMVADCDVMCWQETGLGSEVSYETYTTTSTANTTQASTQLPPAIANLLASTSQQSTNTDLPRTSASNSDAPTTMPVVAPSNSAPLLRQPQPVPPAQCNVPPLPVFLSMPLSLQQQIFQSVPVHIQQQMLSSLPPPLQNQLGPLMGSSAPNSTPPFPVSETDFSRIVTVAFTCRCILIHIVMKMQLAVFTWFVIISTVSELVVVAAAAAGVLMMLRIVMSVGDCSVLLNVMSGCCQPSY